MNHHFTSSDETFFVLEDVIEATRFAMREARARALEYRARGNRDEYRRALNRALGYRRDYARYTAELETVDE